MDKQQQIELMQEHLAERMPTWDSIYDVLSGAGFACLHSIVLGDSGTALNSLAMLHSFVLALKDLPEESEAPAIARRMAEIMVLEGKDRLGIEVSLSDEESARNKEYIDLLQAARPCGSLH